MRVEVLVTRKRMRNETRARGLMSAERKPLGTLSLSRKVATRTVSQSRRVSTASTGRSPPSSTHPSCNSWVR